MPRIITFPEKEENDPEEGENSFADHYKKHEKGIKIIKYKRTKNDEGFTEEAFIKYLKGKDDGNVK